MAITTICGDCKKVMDVEENQYETYTCHSICKSCRPKPVILPYSYKMDADDFCFHVFDEWGNPLESFTDEDDAWELTKHLNEGAGYGNASGAHA